MEILRQSTYNTILQLMRASMYGEPYVLDNDEEINWFDIYRELEQQTISCIVVDVLSQQKDKIPAELYDVWVNRLGLNISSFHRIMSYQDEALKTLMGKKIPVVVLKGSVSASTYPKPEYRTMGDIDLLVPSTKFQEACECLVSVAGYQFMDEGKGELDVRVKQKHVCMSKDGVVLELHIRAFHLQNQEMDLFLNQYMEGGLKEIQWFTLFGYEIPTLPMLQNAVELLLHVKEHFCGVGIGMRQVVDWMLFAERYITDHIYEKELQPILKKIGLEKFAQTLTRLCQLYLGLPEDNIHWCMGAEEILCGEMLAYIFQQGNFGHKKNSDNGARALTRLRRPVDFLKSIQSGGLSNYQELRNKKILRHFAWVPQLGRYIRYVFSKDSNLREDYREGRRRSLLFEKLELFQMQTSEESMTEEPGAVLWSEEGYETEHYNTASLLIELICDVLHNRAPEDIMEQIEESQAHDVIEYATDQGVLMFLNEHPKFHEFIKPEGYMKKVLSSVYLYTLQAEELRQILDVFEERQISCVILKGSRSRELYPKAELRSMGDIDLLYKPEQTKVVQETMESLGYRSNGDNAKHDHYSKKMLMVEMHKTLCVPEWKESVYFETVWDRAHLRDGYHYAYEMTLEDHYLFTFTHLVEHFKSGGIGIRMVLDIYILSQTDNIDWQYVDKILGQLGYQKFHSNIQKIASIWFGDKSDKNILLEFKELERYIVQGGVFGSAENDKTNFRLKYNGRVEYLMKIIFPNYKMMQTIYPWLKIKAMLPVAWIYKWFQTALYRGGSVKAQFRRAKRLEGNRKDVEDRKQFFEKVGLD